MLHRQDSSASIDVTSRLDSIGVGPYQLLLVGAIGFANLLESVEMGAIAPLHTALDRSFGLGTAARAQLPLMTVAGSGMGLFIAGPLCDRWGRKLGLTLSLIIISMSMLATASLRAGTSLFTIMALRFLSGLGSGLQTPAGITLLAESCPAAARATLVFRIGFLSSVGYLIEAFGIRWLMPDFGESATDHWRKFCVLIGLVCALCIPLCFMLFESPCFLAAQGEMEKCEQVLNGMAKFNGQALARPSELYVDAPAMAGISAGTRPITRAVAAALSSHIAMIAMLSVIDGSRTFFISGSSYLWKDLLYLLKGRSVVSPATLNVIGSCAPLLGLYLANRASHRGVHAIACGASLVACCAVGSLMSVSVRSSPGSMLLAMIVTKLTYATLNTCVNLMKVEAFPTKIRASAFAIICINAKLLCATAPTLIEMLKGSERAESWTDGRLNFYISLLFGAALTTGCLTSVVQRTSAVKKEGLDGLKGSLGDCAMQLPAYRYGSTASGKAV